MSSLASSSIMSPYSYKTGSLTVPSQLGWLAGQQAPSHLIAASDLCWGYRHTWQRLIFCVGARDLNSVLELV